MPFTHIFIKSSNFIFAQNVSFHCLYRANYISNLSYHTVFRNLNINKTNPQTKSMYSFDFDLNPHNCRIKTCKKEKKQNYEK